MEAPWKRFTSIFRKTRSQKPPDAESPSSQGSLSAAELNPSPAGPVYTPVGKADAIAELCLPTGDEHRDYLHLILIDLVQNDLISVVRAENDKALRYLPTENGKKFVEEHLQEAVDTLLERIFGDNQ